MPSNRDTGKLYKNPGGEGRERQAASDERSFDRALGQEAPRPAPKPQPATPKSPVPDSKPGLKPNYGPTLSVSPNKGKTTWATSTTISSANSVGPASSSTAA